MEFLKIPELADSRSSACRTREPLDLQPCRARLGFAVFQHNQEARYTTTFIVLIGKCKSLFGGTDWQTTGAALMPTKSPE